MIKQWSPGSWQQYFNSQKINYASNTRLEQIIKILNTMPSLVTVKTIQALKARLAMAGHGHSFILQGGDCAENFYDCSYINIKNKMQILNQMKAILKKSLSHQSITIIGRIAGQYAKPRTVLTETRQNITLPAYRGDLINRSPFNANARQPDPSLLLKGYYYARQTLQYINILKSQAFYTSHEALQLQYEQALTRRNSCGRYYNLSTHLPWLGMRTAKRGSAHLEFLRGINNPVGIKIGPQLNIAELIEIIKILNPHGEHGKLLLITRLGITNVKLILPNLIDTVQSLNLPVTWSCDPMHGNTEMTKEGFKTRCFTTILQELEQTLAIHRQMNSHLGGIHLELTGENVTECIGGHNGPSVEDLKFNYRSLVDPRLNARQALELATLFSQNPIFAKALAAN